MLADAESGVKRLETNKWSRSVELCKYRARSLPDTIP